MSNLIICIVFILIATILIWSIVSAHFKISGLEANMTELQTNILSLEKRMGLERIGTAKIGTVYSVRGLFRNEEFSGIGVYRGINNESEAEFETNKHRTIKIRLNEDFIMSEATEDEKEKFKQEYNLK